MNGQQLHPEGESPGKLEDKEHQNIYESCLLTSISTISTISSHRIWHFGFEVRLNRRESKFVFVVT